MALPSAEAALPQGTTKSRLGLVAACLFVAGLWFLTLDARHLLPSDEGRYAEIAREMLASGDWVTIRYNGVKYFEKPPLHMWMTALSFQAFGVGEWQARLWVALTGAFGIAVTALAARRWFGPRVALFAALILVAAPAWNLAGHFNSLDMGLSGALSCVLAALLIAQHPETSAGARRRWMWLAWAAMAVALLTKGLIGVVLPGMVLVVYSAVTRDFAVWRRLHIASGAILALALATPWFAMVSLRNPEFAHFFFIHEHFQRYLTNVHHRDGAWWYFVPQLLVGFLPWLGLSPGVAAVVRDDARGKGFRPGVLLAAWALTIFVFFSFSGSKLPGYIVPIYPALAILGAAALDRFTPARWSVQVVVAIALAACSLAAAPYVGRLGSEATPNEIYRAFAPWLAAACALAIAGLVLAWFANKRDIRLSVVAYALTIFAASTLVLRGHEAFGHSSSGVDLAAALRPVVGASPIYSVRMLDHTLPFYLGRTTVLVESADELSFGLAQEPQKWLPTLADFVRVWTSGPRAFAVMAPATHALLASQGVAMTVIARDARRVVVANGARPAS
jgi:4-amino-4-deoxy-L-arabinose transferase-like glycosyltransferase